MPLTDKIITITIKKCVGNLVTQEVYNDGLKYPIDKPYRPRWQNAKFRLPGGKPKLEVFSNDRTPEEILTAVQKKYSNLKFKLSEP